MKNVKEVAKTTAAAITVVAFFVFAVVLIASGERTRKESLSRETVKPGQHLGFVSDPSGQGLFQLSLEATEQTPEGGTVPVIARLVPSEGCEFVSLHPTYFYENYEDLGISYFVTLKRGNKLVTCRFGNSLSVKTETPKGEEYTRVVALETPLPTD